jgi:hypothetical protein
MDFGPLPGGLALNLPAAEPFAAVEERVGPRRHSVRENVAIA